MNSGNSCAGRGVLRRAVAVVFHIGVCLSLAALFLRSGTGHLSNSYYFLSAVHRYELLGPASAQIVAAVIPFAELTVSVCLLSRVFVSGALLVSSALLSIFAFAQISALVRGLSISCGCFGAADDAAVGVASIAMVAGLLLAAIGAFACRTESPAAPMKCHRLE